MSLIDGYIYHVVARRGLEANVPTLLSGEIGYDTDKKVLRVGDDTSSPPRIMTNKSVGTFDFSSVTSWVMPGNVPVAGGKVDGVDISALNAANGILVRTGDGTYANRSIVSGDGTLNITNATGVAGNIDIRLSDSLQEVTNVVTNGIGNIQFFPEVNASNGLIACTVSTGQIVINGGQTFVHRGFRTISTDDYLLANRTFTTTANNEYHLRWKWNAGTPVFYIVDVTDLAYNPSAYNDLHTSFDTTVDDMIISHIVTDGSNELTVTYYKNKAFLYAYAAKATIEYQVGGVPDTFSIVTLNWGRAPKIFTNYLSCDTDGPVESIAFWNAAGDQNGSVLNRETLRPSISGYAIGTSPQQFIAGAYRIDMTA